LLVSFSVLKSKDCQQENGNATTIEVPEQHDGADNLLLNAAARLAKRLLFLKKKSHSERGAVDYYRAKMSTRSATTIPAGYHHRKLNNLSFCARV